jgi:ADP-dependent NAD(P)H-hydrate dehydratase / NAD(P)H-hydrate epimerase
MSWLEPLFDADAMRATDRWAIEERGIPSLQLMERAGEGLAALAWEVVPSGPVAVVCGKGNNGGDGFVAARLLRRAGRDVRVLLAVDPGELRGDAAENLRRLPAVAEPFAAERLDGATLILDCVLGTGVTGAPREPLAAVVRAMEEAAAPVVAADVPSGVDASTGAVVGAAVHAAATATFAAGKPGLWISPGKEHAGRVQVVDIGIPPGAPAAPVAGLITAAVFDTVPRRDAAGTKFTSGHVLVAGGSRGLTGAPTLAALGAMRAGAGYVTVLAPASEQPILAIKLTEAMTRALPDRGGHHVAHGADAVIEATGRGGALVLGPGIGREDEALEFARQVAGRADVALVLDADGLNAHAGALERLAARTAPTVLTPHAGELARLLGTDSDAVGARRLQSAREAARRSQAIVVLKGDDTIVAAPDGRVAINPLGAPMLATAGTGDVLSGVLGALLAKGMEPFAAAAAGVRLHAAAGRLAGQRVGRDGVIAGDVAAALPAVLAE